MISHQLHDVVCEALTGINDGLSHLKSESSSSVDELLNEIASIQMLVKNSVDIVQHFAHELRPTVLDDLGLIAALQTFMKTFMEDTGISVTLKAYAKLEALDNTKRVILYRIIQEALGTVASHEQASSVDVSIRELDGFIRLEITDNGHSFDVKANDPRQQSNRLGLFVMGERAMMAGGTLSIVSGPGDLAAIRVEIPVSI